MLKIRSSFEAVNDENSDNFLSCTTPEKWTCLIVVIICIVIMMSPTRIRLLAKPSQNEFRAVIKPTLKNCHLAFVAARHLRRRSKLCNFSSDHSNLKSNNFSLLLLCLHLSRKSIETNCISFSLFHCRLSTC